MPVKELAFSLQQLGSMLWHRFDLWPRNFHMPEAWKKQERKKRKERKKKRKKERKKKDFC